MLAAITATPGQTNYTIGAGDTLTVGGNYDADLNVTFQGGGTVEVLAGADLGQVTLSVDAGVSVGTTRTILRAGATADRVRYFGRGGDDTLSVAGGVDRVLFDASADQGRSSAKATLLLAGNGQIGTITMLGSRGADRLIVDGFVSTGDIAANLGGGDDLVRFGRDAGVQDALVNRPFPDTEPGPGLVEIDTGAGDDAVDFRGGDFDAFRMKTGSGDDTVRILSSATEALPVDFRGAVFMELGSDADQFLSNGRANYQFGATIDAGAGDDYLKLEDISGGNSATEPSLVVRAGTSGAVRDRVEVGETFYSGTVRFEWSGEVLIRETAYNQFGQASSFNTDRSLELVGGGSLNTAFIRLSQFSVARGGYLVDTNSRLRLVSNVSATGASAVARIESAGSGDFVRLNGGGYNAASIDTRGGNDRIELINGSDFFGGGPQINTGSGADIVLLRDIAADRFGGRATQVNFGGQANRTNRLVVRGAAIDTLRVNYAGRTVVSEPAGNVIRELDFSETTGALAGSSPLTYESDDGTFVRDRLTVDATSLVRLTFRGRVGAIDIDTGNQADRIRFIGVQIDDGGVITTRGGDDIVSLESSSVDGPIEVRLGAGADELDNLFAFFADARFDGGSGIDLLLEPNNGEAVSFEEFGPDGDADF